MRVFDKLWLWVDPVRRLGPEAMAVDEWLLETAEMPVLRVYGWAGEWGSIGYFGDLAAAMAYLPEVKWVRRWTGGGTVDHRADWTYTVVAPAGEMLASTRGAGSYQMLHAALAEMLAGEGIDACLSSGGGETGAAACFDNPVSHDIVDSAGRKLAGAGQRRSRQGLLHQGSVAAGDQVRSEGRAARLACCLAKNWETHQFNPPAEVIAAKVRERYGLASWTMRR